MSVANDEVPDEVRSKIEKRLAINDRRSVGYWLENIVPYQFGVQFSNDQEKQRKVYSALKDIMSYTCIKFEPYKQPPPTPGEYLVP